MKRNSFIPLYATNFFGVINDNFLKTLASFVALKWLGEGESKSMFMGLTAGALVLPYILFSPLADRMAAVWSKTKIVRLAKIAEIPIVALAITAFALKSPYLAVAAVLAMGLQSSLYSPAKYALVRDIGGEDRISTGMGGMEGISFLGVLSGTILASLASDMLTTFWHGVILTALALLGLVCSLTIRAEEEISRRLHAINPLRFFLRVRRMVASYDGLGSVISALGVFWWCAATLQMGLLLYGTSVLGLDSTKTGAMLAVTAVGIVAGQISAGFVDKRHFLIGASLLTGWIASAILATLYFTKMPPAVFTAALFLLAFDMGFFKLPLDAEIQKRVKGPKLNTILAYFNQVTFLWMLGASIMYALTGLVFSPRAFLLELAIIMAIAPLWFVFHYRSVMCFTGRWIFSKRYSVTMLGGEAMEDSSRTYLVLPNHPAIVDPMLVGSEMWKTPLRPLADEHFLDRGGVSSLALKTLGAVRVPDLRKHRSAAGAKIARSLTSVVLSALEKSQSVIFYPSGHIQTEKDVDEIGTRQLAYNVCKELPEGVRVVLVRTRGLWGSIWSRANRSSSPGFFTTLLKSILLWPFYALSGRRRKVTMELRDATEDVRAWSRLTRREFNIQLEKWYCG